MRTVYKYEVGFSSSPFNSGVSLWLPAGFKILAFRIQDFYFRFWADVDTIKPKIEVMFWVVGTGQEIPPDAKIYCGTVEDDIGQIWHLYRNEDSK